MSRTLRGRAALNAFVDYLSPSGNRNDYANHQAMLTFLDEIAKSRARYVYPDYGKRISIGQARFRPDQDEDEGTIGFGKRQITLNGIRVRISAAGVLVMSDRWADSIEFSTSADADFDDEDAYSPDEWDLPGPVPPLIIDEAQVAAFSPRIASLVSELLAISQTDRAKVECAICERFRSHTGYYEDGEAGPTIQWYASPHTALAAYKASGRDGLGLVQSLRDRPLSNFNRDVEVRLAGQADALRIALGNSVKLALGADPNERITDSMFREAGWRALHGIGLARDVELLAWYDFLEFNGVVLPEDVRLFSDLTRSVWLLFPTSVVFAVERPTAVERTATDLTFMFADGNALTLLNRKTLPLD